MKKYFAMVILLGCVFCMFPQIKAANPVPKKSEPTLKETLEWIKEKLKDEKLLLMRKSDFLVLIRDSDYILTFENCKVTTTYRSGGIDPTIELKEEFLLSDLDLNLFEYTLHNSSETSSWTDSGHMGILTISTVKKEDKIKGIVCSFPGKWRWHINQHHLPLPVITDLSFTAIGLILSGADPFF